MDFKCGQCLILFDEVCVDCLKVTPSSNHTEVLLNINMLPSKYNLIQIVTFTLECVKELFNTLYINKHYPYIYLVN